MASISYFNVYSLDFSNLDSFKSKVEDLESCLLRDYLNNTLSGKNLNSYLEKAEKMQRLFTIMPGPACPELSQSIENTSNLLKEFSGCDPYELQNVVHCILGIPTTLEFDTSEKIKQSYFEAMKTSGLLRTAQSIDYKYEPHLLTAECLKSHPELNKLVIGCGKLCLTNLGSCYFRRPQDHGNNCFTIDISSSIGSDVVVNMHNPDFWSVIPDERLEKVADHTYGDFLFEDSLSAATLQNIHRVLKSNGILEMGNSFKREHCDLLEKCGFQILDDEKQRTAVKK